MTAKEWYQENKDKIIFLDSTTYRRIDWDFMISNDKMMFTPIGSDISEAIGYDIVRTIRNVEFWIIDEFFKKELI